MEQIIVGICLIFESDFTSASLFSPAICLCKVCFDFMLRESSKASLDFGRIDPYILKNQNSITILKQSSYNYS